MIKVQNKYSKPQGIYIYTISLLLKIQFIVDIGPEQSYNCV